MVDSVVTVNETKAYCKGSISEVYLSSAIAAPDLGIGQRAGGEGRGGG